MGASLDRYRDLDGNLDLDVTGRKRKREEEMRGDGKRVTKDDLEFVMTRLEQELGYRRYVCQGRYGYIGIDVHNKKGGCENTYETGLTKTQAFWVLRHILEGVHQGRNPKPVTAN